MKRVNEVCLIEDDVVQLFLSRKFLELTGVVKSISEFKNGKTAFEAMQMRSENGEPLPDFIFLDLNMPVWDGWQFYEEFLKLPNSDGVIVYILTSSLSDYDFEKAESFGLAERYLSKPVGLERFKEILYSAVKEG